MRPCHPLSSNAAALLDKAFRGWLRAWYGNAVELSRMERVMQKMLRLNLSRAFRKWQEIVGACPAAPRHAAPGLR